MSNIIDTVKRAVIGDSTGKNNNSTATDSSYGPGGASAQRSNFATTGDHDTSGVHDRGIPRQTDVAGGAKHNQQGGSLLGKMTDPRGEFDRDTQVGSGAGSRHTGAGAGFGSNTHGSTNAGPHDSNMANKMDPRVDSDRDGRATHGSTGLGSNTHGTGFGSNTHGSTNAGPHDSNVLNKADPRVDSDRDGRATHGSTGLGSNTHSTTHGSTNAGPHNSNMMNKLDPRVDSDRDGRTTHDTHASAVDHRGASHHKSSTAGGFGMGATDHATSTARPQDHHDSSNAGPHNSNVLNKLDPRVDSDRDNRANPTSHVGGHGNTHSAQHDSQASRGNNFGTGDNTGTARTFGTTTHNTTHLGGNTSTNAGPHDSNVANKMDPRVDSDRDGRATHGTTGISGNTHGSSTHGGPGSAAFAPNAHGSQSTGPGSALGPNTHNSNIANKLDPRVDAAGNHHNTSKMGSQVVGGAHNTHDNQHTAGPHNSDALNKADPRVDSDRDGRAHHNTIGSTTHGTTHMGPTAGTHGSTNAGPHNSNAANKLDPRVDSDRDGRANPASHTGTGHHTNQHVSSMVDGPTVGNAAPPKDLGAHGTHGNTSTGTHTGSTGTTHHGPGGLNKTGHNLPGPAPNTAGPHKSDLLNKLDPRVDSNQDGSKTIGSAPKY